MEGQAFMKKVNIRFWIESAALLALTCVFQSLRLIMGATPVSTYLIGVLVNLCILTATSAVGVPAGLLLSVTAPCVAFLQSYMPAPILPWTVMGNCMIALVYGHFALRINNKVFFYLIAVFPAALLKYGIITLGWTVTVGYADAFIAVYTTQMALMPHHFITTIIAFIIAKSLPASVMNLKFLRKT